MSIKGLTMTEVQVCVWMCVWMCIWDLKTKWKPTKWVRKCEQWLWSVTAEKEAQRTLGNDPPLISFTQRADEDAEQRSLRGRTWKWSGGKRDSGEKFMDGGLWDVRSPSKKGRKKSRVKPVTHCTEQKCFHVSVLGKMWCSCDQIRTHWTEQWSEEDDKC